MKKIPTNDKITTANKEENFQNKLVSVIVPVFNVKPYLEDCLNSIVNQTYKNIEIIIIDDGSTDGSSLLCDSFASRYKNILLIHKSNEGQSAARNIGLKKSHGDYVLFVDSDDYLEVNCIELALAKLQEAKADLCIFNCNHVDENNKHLLSTNLKNEILTKEDIFPRFVTNDKVSFVVPWNKLFARKVVENIVFPYGRTCEDLAVCHLFLENSNRIVTMENCLYNYKIRCGSTTTTPLSAKKILDRILGHESNISYFYDKKYYKIVDHLFYVLIYGFFENYKFCKKANTEVFDKCKKELKSFYKKIKNSLSFKTKLFFHNPFIFMKIRKVVKFICH